MRVTTQRLSLLLALATCVRGQEDMSGTIDDEVATNAKLEEERIAELKKAYGGKIGNGPPKMDVWKGGQGEQRSEGQQVSLGDLNMENRVEEDEKGRTRSVPFCDYDGSNIQAHGNQKSTPESQDDDAKWDIEVIGGWMEACWIIAHEEDAAWRLEEEERVGSLIPPISKCGKVKLYSWCQRDSGCVEKYDNGTSGQKTGRNYLGINYPPMGAMPANEECKKMLQNAGGIQVVRDAIGTVYSNVKPCNAKCNGASAIGPNLRLAVAAWMTVVMIWWSSA